MAAPTTLPVYPRRGETYPDADGVPITSAGAIVAVSQYILDALRDQNLSLTDPYDVYLPDDRTDGTGGLVRSVFGRSGDVVAQPADYEVADIDGLQDALDEKLEASDLTAGLATKAPVGASYVTLGTNATLTSERVLTAGANVVLTDGGPGGALTVAAPNLAPSTAEYLVSAAHAGLANERVLTAGTGVTLTAGAGTLTISAPGGGGGSGTGYPPNYIVVTEAPYNAVGDGTTNDTAAIQAAIDAATSYESVIFFPAGMYLIDDTLVAAVDGTPSLEGLHFLGESPTPGAYDLPTRLIWNGNATDPALHLCGKDFCVEKLSIQPNVNMDLFIGVLHSRTGVGTPFNSRSIYRGVQVTANNVEDRTVTYGVAIGGVGSHDQVSNFENMVFEDCEFSNCLHSGINFRLGQPINTVVERCQFRGYFRAATGATYGGRGITVDSASFSGICRSCDFQSLETWVFLSQPTQAFTILGGQSENCKNFVVTGGPFTQTPGSITISDMRVTTEKTAMLSLGPSVFAGSDHNVFSINNGCGLTLRNNSFSGGTTIPSPFEIEVGSGCPIISEGNTYPNTDPFAMYADTSGVCRYGILSRGDSGQNTPGDANDLEVLPGRTGGVNPHGVVSISGTATSALVSLDHSEVDLSYHVETEIESATWGSTISVPYVTDKSPFGFMLNLSAAPGVGKTVNVRYRPSRDGVAPVSDDPSVALGAVGKWSAASTEASGGSTTSWRPVVPQAFGSGFQVGTYGVLQTERVLDVNLGTRLAVPYGASGSYVNGTVAPFGSFSFLWCGYVTSGTLFELFANPTPGTGVRLAYSGGNLVLSRLAVNLTRAFSAPGAAIIVGTCTTAGASLYVNALTPTTVASASGSFDQASLCLGGQGGGGGYLNGSLAEFSHWNTVLAGGDIADLLADRCAYYGVTLGP